MTTSQDVVCSTEECKFNRSIKPYALDINSKNAKAAKEILNMVVIVGDTQCKEPAGHAETKRPLEKKKMMQRPKGMKGWSSVKQRSQGHKHRRLQRADPESESEVRGTMKLAQS